MDAKYMDIKEFRSEGYLQELNRQFLHPLGLAIGIDIDEDGNESFGGILDCRNDPEGILYHQNILELPRFIKNAENVKKIQDNKSFLRNYLFGFNIQPYK